VNVSPLHLRNNSDFSFIKQDSLSNLLMNMGALTDSFRDLSKEPSHIQHPNTQLLSSQMWDSEIDLDCDDGLEEFQSELEKLNLLRTESNEDSTNEVNSVACVIRACDVSLSDVQLMQSVILAEEASYYGNDKFKTVDIFNTLDTANMALLIIQLEEASHHGKDEFRTVENLNKLGAVKMSFSTTS